MEIIGIDDQDKPTVREAGAKGGKARAENMTRQERIDAARRAAEARWLANLPVATHGSPDHPLHIGNVEIPCYVLADGRRMLVQSGMLTGLDISQGTAGRGSGDRLAKFIAGKAVSPFIPKELRDLIVNPVKFKTQTGNVAYGYEATVLADLCEAVLAARKAGALQRQQEHIAEQCEILVRGFARVGIIALVDEATGYQYERNRDDLRRILEQYVSKELARWERTFEPDFYKHLHRLKGWKYNPKSTQRSHAVAKLTVDLTYHRIHPDLEKELKQIRSDEEKPNSKLFQWMTQGPNGGHPRLKQHLEGVTALMKVATNWAQLKSWVDQIYPLTTTMKHGGSNQLMEESASANEGKPTQRGLFDESEKGQERS